MNNGDRPSRKVPRADDLQALPARLHHDRLLPPALLLGAVPGASEEREATTALSGGCGVPRTLPRMVSSLSAVAVNGATDLNPLADVCPIEFVRRS